MVGGRVATIFTIHRFGVGEPGRLDPEMLRSFLARLRQERFSLLSMRELARVHKERHALPESSVVFTIDDGYHDIATAARVFEEFDCPVTVFLATGFVDGETWLWWNAIEYCMREAGRGQFILAGPRGQAAYSWQTPEQAARAAARLSAALEHLPDVDTRAVVLRLAGELGVAIPPRPTAEWSPLSWDEIRALESRGVEFGPHTVSHPVLTRVDDAQAVWEISHSWERVRAEVRNPVPVLAYPNGSGMAFGAREAELARDSGLEAAVSTHPWYAVRNGHPGETSPFALPRMALPEDVAELVMVSSGVLRLHPRMRPPSTPGVRPT